MVNLFQYKTFPLNTQYDDFAVIVNDNMSKGYFSSNRNTGSGGDDIYSFDLLKEIDISKKIKGIAKNKEGIAIPKTYITLLDDKGNVIDTLSTKDDGAYTFSVGTDKNFRVTGKKEKYTEGYAFANTFGKELIVKADVILLANEEIVVQKIDEQKLKIAADLGIILKLNSIYFNLDKYNIRPDAEIELDKIVKIMNEYPNMTVELSSYTDCRETKEYNQILSDNRETATAKYIKDRITNPKRISGKGYGETKLVNGCACEDDVISDCSDAEHQKNRRTEFIIVSKTIVNNLPLPSIKE
ncbi:MAG: OmpA family protein [Bacteroidales bacterium]|jgi:outer membrane protein OmpA-like peptidoglycan-associated protein